MTDEQLGRIKHLIENDGSGVLVKDDLRALLDERDALITRESELREMLLGVIQDNGGRVSENQINRIRDEHRLRSALKAVCDDLKSAKGPVIHPEDVSPLTWAALCELQESTTHDR